MTHIDVGTAYTPREKRENPLGLYIAIIKEKPDAGERAHRKAFRQLLLSDGYEDFLDAVIDEWQRIKYSTAFRAALPPTVKEIRVAATKRKQERVQEDVAVSTAKAKIAERLFNIVTPNGKALRNCTGAECRKLGGWYSKIATKVGSARIVGRVLTAEDVAALWAGQ